MCLLDYFLNLQQHVLHCDQNQLDVAVTVITTNGVPKIYVSNIIPVCVAAKPTFAIKKNIAVPEIINGTIIGEINKAMNAAL